MRVGVRTGARSRTCQHRDDAGTIRARPRVDAGDRRVRVRAADECRMQHARHLDVVDEAAAPRSSAGSSIRRACAYQASMPIAHSRLSLCGIVFRFGGQDNCGSVPCNDTGVLMASPGFLLVEAICRTITAQIAAFSLRRSVCSRGETAFRRCPAGTVMPGMIVRLANPRARNGGCPWNFRHRTTSIV